MTDVTDAHRAAFKGATDTWGRFTQDEEDAIIAAVLAVPQESHVSVLRQTITAQEVEIGRLRALLEVEKRVTGEARAQVEAQRRTIEQLDSCDCPHDPDGSCVAPRQVEAVRELHKEPCDQCTGVYYDPCPTIIAMDGER